MFYHLGELDDALSYALGAGKLFDINEPSEYVQTTLGELKNYFDCVLCCLLLLSRIAKAGSLQPGCDCSVQIGA